MDLQTINNNTWRLEYLDPRYPITTMNRQQSVEDALALLKDCPTQGRYAYLFEDYVAIGAAYYAYGLPISESKRLFASAAESILKVFELRPDYDTLSGIVPNDDVGSTPTHRPPGQEVDFSDTNSRENRRGVYVSLSAREFGIAHQLSSMALDPPDAPYLGWRSEICNQNDQHLAYALKSVFHGDYDKALSELRSMNSRRQVASEIIESELLKAIMNGRSDDFHFHLEELLRWHYKTARLKRNRNSSNLFLCFPALAMTILATEPGVARFDELPRSNPHFPLDLVRPI